MSNRVIFTIILTIGVSLLITDGISAKGMLDQGQWTYTSSISLSIEPSQTHTTLDQSITAGITGLLTNVEFHAEVTSDRVYFYVNRAGRGGPPLDQMTFVTQLAQGSGVYNIDVSAAKIFLKAGDVFSIGLVGLEGTTPAGSFRAARDKSPDAYPGGALYWRYGGTGWLGLGYDDDMMFRTYVTPSDQEQWTYRSYIELRFDPPVQTHTTYDQSVTAGVTGLLTNVEFDASVSQDSVYFYVNQAGRGGPPLDQMTFSTKLERGSGVYNIDVSAAKILLEAGDVFSIGLVGFEGAGHPIGAFKAAHKNTPEENFDAYPGGVLYWRHGDTGWLGLGYDKDMMFRTYITPTELNCFPQVALGGGFVTTFGFVNNSGTTATGSLTLTDGSGNPLRATLTEADHQPRTDGYEYHTSGEVSSMPVSIAPGAVLFLKADGLHPSDPMKVGWAFLESNGGSLGAVAIYEFSQAGLLKTTVGVLASRPVEAATIPVLNDAAQDRRTAFAVANYGGDEVNIRIVVLDKNGTVVETISPQELNPLGRQQKVARFLDEYDQTKRDFTGSMVLIGENGGLFSVTALVQNQGLYSSIPLIPGTPPNVTK